MKLNVVDIQQGDSQRIGPPTQTKPEVYRGAQCTFPLGNGYPETGQGNRVNSVFTLQSSVVKSIEHCLKLQNFIHFESIHLRRSVRLSLHMRTTVLAKI